MTHERHNWRIGLCLLACVAVGSECSADIAWWVCEDPTGDWYVAENWLVMDPDDPLDWWPGVPTSRESVIIDNGGTARIAAGVASANGVFVGYMRSGTVVQTGGRLETDNLYVGSALAMVGRDPRDPLPPLPPGWLYGRYEIHGGELSVNDWGYVGGAGPGVVAQTGGRCDYDSLYVVSANALAAGRYELSGAAELTATTRLFAFGEYAEIRQTGGSVRGDTVAVGDGGTYTLARGSIDVGSLGFGNAGTEYGPGKGTLAVTSEAVHVEVSERLSFTEGGRLQAVPGTVVHMAGADFVNSGTTAADLADLANTTLIFEGAAGGSREFEVAGTDFDVTTGGFVGNFCHGRIEIGGAGPDSVELFDRHDSDGMSGAPEALYVMGLQIGPGSELNLGGLNVYYLAGRIDSTARIVGPGMITEVDVLDGDANLDGKVDVFDLSALANHYGRANRNWMQADFTGEGDVDVFDLAALANNYGKSAGGSPVPEPATILIVMAAGLPMLLKRRRNA